ncbi:hypothetical protein J6590_104017, partial [Homalodisca vitripennis]
MVSPQLNLPWNYTPQRLHPGQVQEQDLHSLSNEKRMQCYSLVTSKCWDFTPWGSYSGYNTRTIPTTSLVMTNS